MARGNRYNPNTGRRYDPNDPRYTATHEAGHAVASVVLGLELNGVDIKRRPMPGGTSLGFTDSPTPGDIAGKGADAARPYLIQCAAGPLAEGMIAGHGADAEGWRMGYKHDVDSGRRIATVAVCDFVVREGRCEISPAEQMEHADEIQALIEETCSAAALLVEDYRTAIIKVADALIERTALTGDEVREVVERFPGDRSPELVAYCGEEIIAHVAEARAAGSVAPVGFVVTAVAFDGLCSPLARLISHPHVKPDEAEDDLLIGAGDRGMIERCVSETIPGLLAAVRGELDKMFAKNDGPPVVLVYKDHVAVTTCVNKVEMN